MDDDRADEDKRPASRRVADQLQARIEAGEFAAGDALPPYRQLAAEYGVAVNTALAAVRALRDAGLVTIRPNSGAQVRGRSDDVDVGREVMAISNEVADLRATVQRVGTDLARLEERLAEVASRTRED
ncbi:GntR family transcriptional regulator [Pseudonocardia acaciae]|uniref:GntR family transcriptional regulator n=1 Tax=Pseudonocardia acaciae TaxID=551276 RepID=UPI00146FF9DE|nr:winged helix-turn-helix domain-containing protein [Pseudonocardia acaciae]